MELCVGFGRSGHYSGLMTASDSRSQSSSQRLSARGLVWLDPESNQAAVDAFATRTGLDLVLSSFLVQRGVAADQVEDFLNPTLKAFCPDPSEFADMDVAATEIATAILTGKRVAVFADYDVDGATSAAQLFRYFSHFDRPLDLYVPDRLKEGYGPSPSAFDFLKRKGIDLVITVDCGAAAEQALGHARTIDLPVIVLDHHLMHGNIPDCVALVNPNRPDCRSGQGHLAAAGVVFMILIALNRHFRTIQGYAQSDLPDLMTFLDLCALGTLCDMAPLTGVNRAFVMQGLKVISRDDSAGLLALSQVSGRSAPRSVTDLTFGIGPQLNAGGRIGDPWLASKLLSVGTIEEALPLAEQLNVLNEARKSVENDILAEARRQVARELEDIPHRKVLVVAGEGWHPGIIGIVAGRLKDEFHRPVIVIGYGEEIGDLAKGSARSVPGINIGNAIASAVDAGLLHSGGGHAMAGGLSMVVDRLPVLIEFLDGYCQGHDTALEEARTVQIAQDLLGSSVNLQLIDIVERAGPYGAGAPKPLFRLKGVQVDFARTVGEQHKKITMTDGSARIDGIAWRVEGRPLGDILRKDALIDVIGYLERNRWQGRDAVQFEIFDAMENS